MTDETLPQPPIPANVDLRSFPFAPIDVTRLFASDFHARASDAEWRAGFTLWLKSWLQVPAGSLPADDAALAKLTDFGRDLAGWHEVKQMALHGWALCNDGRLYHSVMVEKALDAWLSKLSNRQKSAVANAKRWNHEPDIAATESDFAIAATALKAINPNSPAFRKYRISAKTADPILRASNTYATSNPSRNPSRNPSGNATSNPCAIPTITDTDTDTDTDNIIIKGRAEKDLGECRDAELVGTAPLFEPTQEDALDPAMNCATPDSGVASQPVTNGAKVIAMPVSSIAKPRTETVQPPKPDRAPTSAKSKRVAKVKTEWPPDFEFDAKLRAYAEEKGFRAAAADTLFESFHNKALKNGWKYIDWRHAWRDHVMTEVKWAEERRQQRTGTSQPPAAGKFML